MLAEPPSAAHAQDVGYAVRNTLRDFPPPVPPGPTGLGLWRELRQVRSRGLLIIVSTFSFTR